MARSNKKKKRDSIIAGTAIAGAGMAAVVVIATRKGTPPAPPGQLDLTILSEFGGELHPGHTVIIRQQGVEKGRHETPGTFRLNAGQVYEVEILGHDEHSFDFWKDNNSPFPFREVTLQDNTTLTAVFKPAPSPPGPSPGPSPPPPAPTPPPPSTSPITGVQLKYWHLLPTGYNANAKIIVGYTASSAIVGHDIFGVLEVYDAAGTLVKTDRDCFIGKTADNLPLTTNLDLGLNNARFSYYFTDSARRMISARYELPGLIMGTTSKTYRPPAPSGDQSNPVNRVTTRFLYCHYRPLADGTYQIEIDFTYRTGPEHVGIIKRAMAEVIDHTNGNRMQIVGGPFAILEDSTAIVKHGMAELGNPSNVNLRMWIIDDATKGRVSNIATFDGMGRAIEGKCGSGIYP